MEDNHLSFDIIIRVIHNQTKINTTEILQKYKISPKQKARMVVALCQMVSMMVVRPALKIDILKMEQAFHMGYKEGDKVFYLSLMSWKGKEQNVFLHSGTWDEHWVIEMNNLKRCYKKTQSWCASPTRCFLCGTRTTTSRVGCHTLADCTMMIHPSTYF
jgi:hypothetical protein